MELWSPIRLNRSLGAGGNLRLHIEPPCSGRNVEDLLTACCWRHQQASRSNAVADTLISSGALIQECAWRAFRLVDFSVPAGAVEFRQIVGSHLLGIQQR